MDVEGAVCLLRELVPHLKVKCEKITNTQGAVAVDCLNFYVFWDCVKI